jgi:hypothetical protein
MKIKLIENPRDEQSIVKMSLSSILSEQELKNLVGGGPTCGYHVSCDKSGKSSCMPYTCDQKTSCTDIRVWNY